MVEATTIALSAANGILLGGGLYSPDGQITLNADADSDGTGDLTLQDNVAGFFTEQATLVDNEPGEQYAYGNRALSGDGNTLAITAAKTNVDGQLKYGGLYSSTPRLVRPGPYKQKLANTGNFTESFGAVSLSHDGNTAVVSNYKATVSTIAEAGLAVVFTRNGTVWSEQARLFAPTAAISNYFGYSVALTPAGNMLIVTSLQFDVGANQNQGAAFVFVRSGNSWTNTQMLTKSTGVAGEYFGQLVTISRDGLTAVISAWSIGTGLSQGSAVVYTLNGSTWQEQQILVSNDRHTNDGFSQSTAMSADGNVIVVSASGYRVDGFFTQRGAFYIFLRSGNSWIQHQKIIQPKGITNDTFARNVAISADGGLILASRSDTGALTGAGSTFAFVRRGPTWDFLQKFEKTGGLSLNAQGTQAILGNGIISATFSYQGAAFVYDSSRDPATEPAGWIKSLNDVELTAAGYDLRGRVQSQTSVYLKGSQTSRLIDVGTNSAGNIGLTESELDRITAPSIVIGRGASGPLSGGVVISTPIVLNYLTASELELAAGNAANIAFATNGSIDTRNINLRFRLDGNGRVLSGDATTDIKVGTGTVSFNLAGGGTGQNTNPLVISGAKISSTATGSADQYLQVPDTILIAPAGLSAGTGNIQWTGGTLKLSSSEQIDDNTGFIQTGGILEITTFNETVSRYSGIFGTLSGTTGTLKVNSQIQADWFSILTKIQTTAGLRKFGSGTTSIYTTLPYSGNTLIESGTLSMNTVGHIPNSPVVDLQAAGSLSTNDWQMADGQVLQGAGTVTAGAVKIGPNGRIAPGPNAATMSTRALVFNGGYLDIELFGTGTNQYDQLDVRGTISARGGTLNVSIASGANIPAGSQFKIINNDGTDAVFTTFPALPEGAVFSVGSGADARAFQITYLGGDGNDVVLTALAQLSLAIAPASISEKNGVATATLSRIGTDTSTAQTVSLQSSDTSEATVPATVVIPAGASSVMFDVTAVDDSLLDGPQAVTITASASTFISGSGTLQVLDDETLAVTIAPGAISERGGSAVGTVTRSNTDIGSSLLVTLTSSKPSEATVPATVLIGANQASATFAIGAVDDSLLDGNAVVSITAAANGYLSAPGSLTVTDYETLTLTLAVHSMLELNGSITGTVIRNNTDIALAQTIALTSSDTSEATVPATVTIPAGQSSITFPITSVDDALLDGPQTVTISVEAVGYVGDTQSLSVLDVESLSLTIVPGEISEQGGAATATLVRNNTDIAQQLIVQLTVDDVSEVTLPSSVVIPAGQSSVSFSIAAIDDNLLDGTQQVIVAAQHTAYQAATSTLAITDWEPLTLSVPVSAIIENGGTTTATINRLSTDTSQAVTVTLVSSDTSELTVPATVTIAAGQLTAEFPISAVDDTLLDGAQSVTISASAAGYVSSSQAISVLDYETLSLTIAPASISEAGGQATATITRNNTDIAQALTINLVSSDTTEAIAPSTVTIAANALSTTVTILAIDDNLLDGTQAVVIAPSANGYFTQDASLDVTDFEPLTLTITSSSISERGQTTQARIARTDASVPLVITLASSDISEATVPATIALAAGQLAADFTITAIDDSLLDGPQTVTITASGSTYVAATQAISITDYEDLLVTLQATSISEFGGATLGTVRRSNTDLSSALTVLLASSDLSEASVPATVVIPSGQSSATFSVQAADDSLLDGRQTLTISATAIGYVGGSADLQVDDHEVVSMSLGQTSISENGGSTTATLTRSNTDTDATLTVSIIGSDASEALAPSAVTIPVGQASVTFAITAQDDTLLDGAQTVNITATAAGYVGETKAIVVTDYETLSVTVDRAIINEQGGLATGTVRRSNTDLAQALVVTLVNNDPSETTLPTTVTIPANQTTATFTIAALDDGIDDGAQTVGITASASGYVSVPGSIIVADGVALALSFDVTTLSELGGTAMGTVTRATTDIGADMLVVLTSSDTSEIVVPASVTIRAGQVSANFNVLAVDDTLLDGTQVVTVTAQAFSITPSQAKLSVTDYETLSLQIDRASISEADGQAVAVVSRSNLDFSQELIVNLSSSDTSELIVPASVTIPANRSSVSFSLAAVDDALLDGTQRVAVTVSAVGYVGSSKDIDITDAESLTIAIQAATISENGGVTTGLVSRSNTDTSAALVVSLVSSDTSEVFVPVTVTIPGGQGSASFTITAVDDTLLDGTQLASISASAAGYASASGSLSVADFESLQLSLSATAISENNGQALVTLSRSNTDTAQSLIVSLTSSDISEARVPATVTILAGQSSVTFALDAIDDALLDGSQSVVITAVASGYTGAQSSFVVTDYEALGLQIQSGRISEAGGVTIGTITRSNTDTAAALTVALTNSDTTELDVPATVTIPAGLSSTNFPINAVDDTLLDGMQHVAIGVRAAGYIGSASSVEVTDAESLALVLTTDSMSEAGGRILAVVSRSNTNVDSDLTINLLSSDTTEAAVVTTVVIPAGRSSVEFPIHAVDDSLLDGMQSVSVRADANGYTGAVQSLVVADAEQLTVSVSRSTISESDGSSTATITRSNTDIDLPLTVTVASSDVTEAVMPSTITIPAGQSSATFAVRAVDDTLLDGAQSLAISVTATGYAGGQQDLTVTDYETLTLALSTHQAKEDSGTLTATVSRNNTDVDLALIVSLSSSDPSELVAPATVTIPAGQSNVSFLLTVVDDSLLDGIQLVGVLANSTGYEGSSQSMSILDAEELTMTIDSTSFSENTGSASVLLTRSNTDVAQALIVTLASSDTTEAIVPLTVTIPANQTSVAFQLTAVDDSWLDGPQTVLVSAEATGYASAIRAVTVLDAESLGIRVSQSVFREAASEIAAVVSRSNTDTLEALVVNLASSDTTEATVPRVVTIPAGQTSVVITIAAVDDTLLDGAQHIQVSASAAGYASSTVDIEVTDVESLRLSIADSLIAEHGIATSATISRSNTDTEQSLVVSLAAGDGSQLDLPATVTIPAGEQSVSFPIKAVADQLLDGLQVVLVEVSAPGYESDASALSVADGETLTLTIDVSSISEKNGEAVGRVSRSNADNQQPLTVQLVNSNSAQAITSASVLIPAGQSSATFRISSVNDTAVDGTQSIQIGVVASGYLSDEATLDITDDDRLYPWNNPRNPLDVNDNGVVTALDALLVINALNTRIQLSSTLPDPFDPVQYLDVDPNGLVTPLDALLVINELNRPRSGEGENAAPMTLDPWVDIIDLLAADSVQRKRIRTSQK